MKQKVINNFNKPLCLDSGVILAASGTEGSIREGLELSESDKRRLVDSGLVAIVVPEKEATPQTTSKKEGK